MICLGPYKITSSHFSDELGPIFVDHSKTRQVAVLSPDGSITPPASDAVLLMEKISEEGIIHWYECPSELGRVYSIFPSPCGVSISSFENGLLSLGKSLKASDFGYDFFCFFKLYLGTQTYIGDSCSTTFEFDGHPFSVSGVQSVDPGIVSCDICLDEFQSSEISMFSMLGPTQPGEGTLPDAPTEFTTPTVVDTETFEGTTVVAEDRPDWGTASPAVMVTPTSEGITCFSEDGSISALMDPGDIECESQRSPSIAIRPSGSAVITYDKYGAEGLAQLAVAQVPTSVVNKILYHRALSKGRLINNVTDNGNVQFEIYDDVTVTVSEFDGIVDNTDAGFTILPGADWEEEIQWGDEYPLGDSNSNFRWVQTIAPSIVDLVVDNTDAGFTVTGSWFLLASDSAYPAPGNFRWSSSSDPSADPIEIDNSDSGFTATGAWSTLTGGGQKGDDYLIVTQLADQTIADIIIDNTDAEFELVGDWVHDVSSQPDTAWLGTFRRTQSRDLVGFPTRYARWTPTISVAGRYNVEAWWPSSQIQTSATYHIVGSTETKDIAKSQTTLGNQWNFLANINFDVGTSGFIRVSNAVTSPTRQVAADAVRLSAAGATFSEAVWRPNIPVTESYKVEVWFPTNGGATSVIYTINHDEIEDTVLVDQTQDSGSWVDIGSYNFAAGTGGFVSINNLDGLALADAVRFTPNSVSGTPLAEAKWQPTWPNDGEYEVSVWFPSFQDATDVVYTVHYDGGEKDYTVNQSTGNGDWVILGKHDFVGTEGHVTLSNTTVASGKVLADAVRFVDVNGSSPDVAEVEWRPTLPSNGIYEVFVWFPSGFSSIDVSYVVHHIDETTGSPTTTTVIRDQGSGGGNWVSLGDNFNFLKGEKGETGYVTLNNISAVDGVVVADAVRFDLRVVISSLMQVGFLSGPLKGNLFFTNSMIPELQDNGWPKHIINFNLNSVPLVFPDRTNDLYDIEWILVDSGISIGPGSTITEINSDNTLALTIPAHTFEGEEVPAVSSSAVYAKNNYMLDNSEYKYTAYQAFENKQWNIHLSQSRTVDKTPTDSTVNPVYEPPYDTMIQPVYSLASANFDEVIYEVIETVEQDTGGTTYLYVMLLVKSPSGSILADCSQATGTRNTVGIYPVGDFLKRTVSVEVRYNMTLCGTDGIDSFAIGATFTGRFPLTEDVFGVDCTGAPASTAIEVLDSYPSSTSDWCYWVSNCIQTSLYDDPYCPVYIALEYKPYDLWTLDNDDNIITRVKYHLSVIISNSTVVERTVSGFGGTYLKPAEVIITYSTDLSELWTQDKTSLEFTSTVPDRTGNTKGLSGLPYTTIGGIYGIDAVHLVGDTSLWVYFPEPGSIKISNAQTGINSPSQTRIQLASNAINPVIAVNYNNEVFVAYENLEFGVHQLAIKGTGDFAQNSIIGPRGSRLTKFYSSSDFIFEHYITLSGEGVNQVCDLISDKSNVLHIVWQSNRDDVWEIYYANGYNMFEPVRITKSDSRSTRPSIDIDDDGNVYVVYQDDRFGRYEVMLSYKTDTRVTPLLQQDAYMASLRNDYTHYTNVLPITISNPVGNLQTAGIMWVVHNNVIYDINETTGAMAELGEGSFESAVFGNILAIAGSLDGYLYAVTDTNKLLQLIAPNNDPYLFINEADVVDLGTISGLPTGYEIRDMAIDTLNSNMWLVMSLENDTGFNVNISQVDITTQDVLLSGVVYTNATSRNMSIACILGGTFYLTTTRVGGIVLSTSDFPHYVNSVLLFDFNDINTDMGADIVSLSSNNMDELFATDNIGNFYSVNRVSGVITSIVNTLSNISHLGYQFSGVADTTGSPALFHILLEFYDNIGLVGNPVVTIDSRDNLDAFVRSDSYFASANGVAISPGGQVVVYFNAANFRPGYPRFAYPYGFDANQTYFPKVFRIDSAGSIDPETEEQLTSLSCTKCSSLSGNDFDAHNCSYSFTVTNSGNTSYFNIMVNFFADSTKGDLVRSFVLQSTSSDLQYVEVNNETASSVWAENGLLIGNSESNLIQIYPAIDDEANFLCGINYYVDVLLCSSTNSRCSSFVESSLVADDGVFYCDCASYIFAERQVALSQLGRWQSSGQGYSDTRVTDSPQDSLKPEVNIRSSGAAVITFEDYENNQANLKAATFRLSNTTELFGSGTRSWFDYSPDVGCPGGECKNGVCVGGSESGKICGERNISSKLDIQDVLASIYERNYDPGGGKQQPAIPSTSLFASNCDFDTEVSGAVGATGTGCDISSITDNVITSDPFIMEQVIRRIVVKSEDVEYFTYNSSGAVVPVVSKCDINLQIWGTPEVAAMRFRNEEDDTYSNWCPWTATISDYYTEMKHTLSFDSGSKEVCVQIMTYNGVTVEFCVPVIADYRKAIFELKMYADVDRTTLLPVYEGSHVASIITSNGFAEEKRTIYLDIVPSEQLDVTKVNFDVLQQGVGDQFDLEAEAIVTTSGPQIFRGQFDVFLEDNISHLDGVARIRAKLPGSCEKATEGFVTASFTRDKYNLMSTDSQAAEEDAGDIFADYRQEVTGRIGVDVVLRPSNDPYLIFGDPDGFLARQEPKQQGVIPEGIFTINTGGDGTSGDGTGDGDVGGQE